MGKRVREEGDEVWLLIGEGEVEIFVEGKGEGEGIRRGVEIGE